MTARPIDADLDTADEAHEVLDSLPPWKRTAAAALLALPADMPLAALTHPATGRIDGALTVDQLLADLRLDVASPDVVLRLLRHRRALLPGLTGIS